jgi:hypothetical protein
LDIKEYLTARSLSNKIRNIANYFIMKNLESNRLLEKGLVQLSFAESEMEHSPENVVNYLVCHNTRKAITNFLNSYLLLYNASAEEAPIQRLLDQCCALDSRFAALDLSNLDCRGYTVGQNDCYCYDLDNVKECLGLARQVERLVTTWALA